MIIFYTVHPNLPYSPLIALPRLILTKEQAYKYPHMPKQFEDRFNAVFDEVFERYWPDSAPAK